MFLSEKDAEKIFKKFDERKELLIEIKESIDKITESLKEPMDKIATTHMDVVSLQKDIAEIRKTATKTQEKTKHHR